MKAGLNQSTQLKQELKINPRLYQAMDLLYMPLLDLQQHLKQELLNNPFLEILGLGDFFAVGCFLFVVLGFDKLKERIRQQLLLEVLLQVQQRHV